MNNLVVIRDYRPGDDLYCRDVLKEGAMSTLNAAFIAALTREVTFQIIVLTGAVLFIFCGVPFSFCFATIPLVVVFMYVTVWLGHQFKILEMMQDVSNIPRAYMSSEHTGFWVAEVHEPHFLMREPREVKYKVITEREAIMNNVDLMSQQKKIVGTIAVTRSRNSESVAWIKRMSVNAKYQRKGIASALVDEALRFCAAKGYTSVELVTSECHEVARELYLQKGFELKQMYHQHIVGRVISILMYELVFFIKSNRMGTNP